MKQLGSTLVLSILILCSILIAFSKETIATNENSFALRGSLSTFPFNAHMIDLTYCNNYIYFSSDYRENQVIKVDATTGK